jgi:hypothetical protein
LIKRILIQSFDSPVVFSGEAKKEDDVIKFKNKLISGADIKNVDLPLSQIRMGEGGNVSFSLTFNIKSR